MRAPKDLARKLVAQHYGADFASSIRFVKRQGCTILCRPGYETALGLPTLCWRKLEAGDDALVWIGALTASNSIDWTWTPYGRPESAVLAELEAT